VQEESCKSLPAPTNYRGQGEPPSHGRTSFIGCAKCGSVAVLFKTYEVPLFGSGFKTIAVFVTDTSDTTFRGIYSELGKL